MGYIAALNLLSTKVSSRSERRQTVLRFLSPRLSATGPPRHFSALRSHRCFSPCVPQASHSASLLPSAFLRSQWPKFNMSTQQCIKRAAAAVISNQNRNPCAGNYWRWRTTMQTIGARWHSGAKHERRVSVSPKLTWKWRSSARLTLAWNAEDFTLHL